MTKKRIYPQLCSKTWSKAPSRFLCFHQMLFLSDVNRTYIRVKYIVHGLPSEKHPTWLFFQTTFDGQDWISNQPSQSRRDGIILCDTPSQCPAAGARCMTCIIWLSAKLLHNVDPGIPSYSPTAATSPHRGRTENERVSRDHELLHDIILRTDVLQTWAIHVIACAVTRLLTHPGIPGTRRERPGGCINIPNTEYLRPMYSE